MNARSLTDYIEPLLAPDLAHIQHIRIGTQGGGLLAAAVRYGQGCR